MRRDENSQLESAGQDSFLDVTTNIVGILIVLVMIIGMRAQNPIVEPNDPMAPSEGALASLEQSAAQVEYDWRRIAQELSSVESEISVRASQCQAQATLIAGAEKEVADRRARLDASEQEAFDLQRQADESREIIQRGMAELEALQMQKPPVKQVNHYPTPMSRTVTGREVHFQLLNGRVTYVPIADFIEDVRASLRSAGIDYSRIADKVGVVGPRNGFEFRYTMDVITDRGQGIVGLQAKEFQAVPVGVQMGEPVEKSLLPQSEFRNALASHSPRDTSVTLWTYPDSFEAYRQLKEELHRMGFATAGRPLPKGVLIGGSSRGTKSSAQ